MGAFIDDLATGGSSHAHNAKNTGKMFAMLKDLNLKAGAEKVFLGLEEIAFLGFKLSAG